MNPGYQTTKELRSTLSLGRDDGQHRLYLLPAGTRDRLPPVQKMRHGLMNLHWPRNLEENPVCTDENSYNAMLNRARKRGVNPATIVDLGSSDGRWSDMARGVWPDAKLLLIDANPVHEPGARVFCARAGAKFVLALAGANVGTQHVRFNTTDPFQGIDAQHGGEPVPVTTVDVEVARLNLPAPYLVKFDTHGHEAAILEGALGVMAKACAVAMEVYLFEPCPGAALMPDMCRRLERFGLRASDLCEPLRRPLDERLYQVDMLFERIEATGMRTGGYFTDAG